MTASFRSSPPSVSVPSGWRWHVDVEDVEELFEMSVLVLLIL